MLASDEVVQDRPNGDQSPLDLGAEEDADRPGEGDPEIAGGPPAIAFIDQQQRRGEFDGQRDRLRFSLIQGCRQSSDQRRVTRRLDLDPADLLSLPHYAGSRRGISGTCNFHPNRGRNKDRLMKFPQ